MNWLAIIAAETIIASVVAFVLYGWDKHVAQQNNKTNNGNEQTPGSRSRIPEQTLLGVSLIGGWPGGFIASRLFRHKTHKRSYRIKFALVVFLHVATLAAILYWR